MTEQEIKDNAPDGATHYKVYGLLVVYYLIKSHLVFRYKKSEKSWIRCSMCDSSKLKPL